MGTPASQQPRRDMGAAASAGSTAGPARLVQLPAAALVSVWCLAASVAHLHISDEAGDALGYSWLASNWMFIHTAVGVTALFLLFRRPRFDDLNWVTLFVCALYTIHQFEEHAYDVFGRRFAFANHLAKILGCDGVTVNYRHTPSSHPIDVTGCVGVDQQTIMWVNVYVVQIMFLLPLFLPEGRRPFAVLMNLMCAGVNAVLFHVIAGAKAGSYNPGLVQSLLLNGPVSFYFMRRLYRAGAVTGRQLGLACLLIGVPGQPLLAAGPMVLANKKIVSYATFHWYQFAFNFAMQMVTFLVPPVDPARLKRKDSGAPVS